MAKITYANKSTGDSVTATEFNQIKTVVNGIDDAVENIQLIPGPQGEQGPKGDAGEKGETGDRGLQGIQGIQGLPGADGEDGSDGAQGIQGEVGPQGIQGVKGDTGSQGIQGLKGDTGSQGIQGAKGDKGDTGDSGIVTLTTTGTSGAATYNSTTKALNIPNYATGGGGSGDVTTTTDQTITGKKRMTQPTLLQPLITGAPNAIGDGIVDDAPALQDAIYFAGDNKRVLVLPAGTFLLKSQLNLNTNNLTIRGAGIGKTILKVASDYSGTGAPIITYGKATNLTIEDLEITGNAKMVEAAIRLNSYDTESTQSTNVFINRVSIHDFWGIGILLGSTSESPDTHSIDELTISNCHIYNIGNPAQPITYTDSDLKYDAINLNGTTKRSMIINNYIHNVAGDGIFSWGRVQSTPNNDYGNMLVEGNQIEMCWMSIEVNGNYLGKGLRINNNLFRHATRNGGYLISVDSDHASVTNNVLYGEDRALIEFTGIGGIIANNTGQIVPWSSTTGGVPPTALVGVCNFVEAYGFENTIENNIFTYPVGRTGSGTYSPVELRGIKLISRTTDPTYQASSYDGVTDLSAYWNIKLNTISGFTHRAIDVTNEKMRKVVLQSNTFRSRNAVETVIPIYGYDWTIEECIFDMTGSTPNASNGVVEVFSPQTDNSNSLFTNNTIINDAWKILNPNGYFVSYYNRFKTTAGTNYVVDEYPIITQAQRLALTPVSGMIARQSDAPTGVYEYDGTQWINKGIDDDYVKAPVRVATTTNVTLSGLQTIDGLTLVAGDRVLVKSQTTSSQNGIYIAASGVWSRSADADSPSKLTGALVMVSAGTSNSFSVYGQSNTIVAVGTTAVNFVQSFKTGTNLALSGNTLSVTTAPTFTGRVTALDFRVSALQTAPASATATGTLGEIRWTNGFVYLCVATNTWIRAALATW